MLVKLREYHFHLSYDRIQTQRISYYVAICVFRFASFHQKRKAAAFFRKNLEKDGFSMMQFSVYIRHCASRESLDVHVRRVKALLPETGKVSILSVTDKQYGDIYNFWGKPKSKKKSKITQKVIGAPIQLEFF